MTENFRKSAPASLAVVPFNVPRPEVKKLANGLTLVLVEDKRNPLITLRLAFRCGDVFNPPNKNGLNTAVAALLNEGTEKMTSSEIAAEIENLGASLSVSSGLDNTLVSAQTLSNHVGSVMQIIADVVKIPSFPESELSLYKKNTIEALKFQRSQPDFLADEQLSKIVFGDHPYGDSTPNEEEIENISRSDIEEFFRYWYVPNNAVLFAVGDFDESEFTSVADNFFGSWQPGEFTVPEMSEIPTRTNRSTMFVHRPGSSQANIVLGDLGIKRNNPEYFSTLVMNQVLGGGASSRLFMNLREEKGYTYGAYSRFYYRKYSGAFEMSIEARNEVAGASLKEMLKEAEGIRTEKVPKTELDDAENYIAGVFPISAETQSGLMLLTQSMILNNLPDDYLETYRENIRCISADDVMRAAREYVQPDKMALVVVGDAKEVLPQIAFFSDDISIVDVQGNSIEIDSIIVPDDAPVANFAGEWELLLNAQGQELPVQLLLEQTEKELDGRFVSMLGEGKIEKGSVAGNTFTATVVSEFQGQGIEFTISGLVSDGSLNGTVSIPISPEPFAFSGKKKEKTP
ncbi:MAG: M16 family metallopeptidase [Pyrinomonadaceae bacterium]